MLTFTELKTTQKKYQFPVLLLNKWVVFSFYPSFTHPSFYFRKNKMIAFDVVM